MYNHFCVSSVVLALSHGITQSPSICVTIVYSCVLEPFKTCRYLKSYPSCIIRDAHKITTFVSAIPILPHSLTQRPSALRSPSSTSSREYLLFANCSFRKPWSVQFATYLLRKLTSSPLSARTGGTTSIYYLIIHHNPIGIRRLVHPYCWKYSNLHPISD
jgi:hypothetical protein